jgi:hypothetical protein
LASLPYPGTESLPPLQPLAPSCCPVIRQDFFFENALSTILIKGS